MSSKLSTQARALQLRLLPSLQQWLWAAGVAAMSAFALDIARALLGSGSISLSPVAALALLCGHLFLQGVAVGVGVIAWSAGLIAGRVIQRAWVRDVVVPAAVLVGLAWIPLRAAGVQLASGPWISEQSFAPAVRVAPLVAGLVAAPVIAALVWGQSAASPRRRRVLTSLLFAGAAVIAIADHKLVPGLYPEFHMLAYVGTALLLLIAAHRVIEDAWDDRPRRGRGLFAIAIAAFTLASPLPWFVANSKVRAQLLLVSPTARHWIRTVLPQPKSTPLLAALEDLDMSSGTLDRAGDEVPRGLITGTENMNVLFVVVDALRADAVPPVRPAEGNRFIDPGDTPFIDEWMSTAFRFSRCYTAATATRMAMPALFRSIHVNDDPVKHGVPAGERMEALGLTPVAVVLDWFISGKWPAAGALLDGFEEVVVYEQSENDRVVGHTRDLLTKVKGRRFFAWVHLFEVHDPGYDGKLLKASDGSRVERYHRAMRYLDGDFKQVVELLDEFGVREQTIVVFVADHGEGLGDHGVQLHGPNVYEEAVHVPLAIAIPGREGHVIDDLVGTIDVMPTVIDLLGAPRDSNDRGRSLVPIMAGHEDTEEHTYYFQNGEADTFGVIVGTDKLFWEPRTDLLFRSDLAADPGELEYRWDPEGEIDRALMRRLIQFNPELVKDELDDPDIAALIEQHLQEVDPGEPGAAFPFVLRLAGLRPASATLDRAVEIFEEASDSRVRLLVLRHVFAAKPSRFEKPVARWIEELAGTPEELAVVSALARQGQPAVAGKTVVARMEHWVEAGKPEDWEPYLMLVRPWSKTPKFFTGVFVAMLDRIREAPADTVPPRIVELVLDNVASMKEAPVEELVDVTKACRALIVHDEPRIRAAALRAVGGLKDQEARAQVEAKLDDKAENPRVRREAAAALVSLADKDAIDHLVKIAEDPLLTAVVLRQLKRLGDPSVLPFLRDLRKAHSSGWIRIELDRLIKELQAKEEKPRKKGKRG